MPIDASAMLMPEAPMDQYNCMVAPQHNIRLPWQITCVEPEP